MLETMLEKIIYVAILTAICAMPIWKGNEAMRFSKETRNFLTFAFVECMSVLLFIGLFGDKINEFYARIFH